jgi:biopolymer transport protein ExbD
VRFRRSPGRTARIDIINLIDVVFVTLIFFMLATTFSREGKLQVTLPEAAAQPSEQRQTRIELVISADGNFAVAGRSLADDRVQTILAALRDASDGDTDRPLVITADGKTPHELVVRAMDAAGRGGFARLSITTREPAAGSTEAP